ncbi:MAG: pyridoxamine 5'-phosphate oxidase [Zavarzinella sp.]
MTVADIRKEYTQQELTEDSVLESPFAQFDQWFNQSLAANVPEPNAMTLATVNESGQPSARIVLLKGYDVRGLKFFTNYLSRKGLELAGNPHAALVFFWPELERQVRIEGTVVKVSEEESDEYYHSRPRNSRLGAWASQQSEVLTTREELAARQEEFDRRYAGQEIPRPPHWGGYILQPVMFEFWQGRPSRLHDRIVYQWQAGSWHRLRLSP